MNWFIFTLLSRNDYNDDELQLDHFRKDYGIRFNGGGVVKRRRDKSDEIKRGIVTVVSVGILNVKEEVVLYLRHFLL